MGMSVQILINGAPGDSAEAPSLPIADRGLAYGDGVFETIAIAHRRPEFWDRHMTRLQQGCRVLRLPPPDRENLARQTDLLCRALPASGDESRAIVKITLTRGVGGRGYAPPPRARPAIIVARYDWPTYPPHWAVDGVTVRLCQLRLGRQPALAGVKHLNRLENVLARSEWDDPGIAEGLLSDDRACLIEGTMSNLFILDEDGLATPDLKGCGVAGIMRGVILDLAAEMGLDVVIRDIKASELLNARGAFLTNSVMGLWPIREILAGPVFSPAPIVAKLQKALGEKRAAQTALSIGK